MRTAAVFAWLSASALAGPVADFVADLPLFGKPPTPQYSVHLSTAYSAV